MKIIYLPDTEAYINLELICAILKESFGEWAIWFAGDDAPVRINQDELEMIERHVGL